MESYFLISCCYVLVVHTIINKYAEIISTKCYHMEGILWKWTNYWNGWQTRWFILENGILSYYKSQEEVVQGCKGSVKVSVCQINVNNIDNTRLDLVIPGQQHMYLRAPSPQDRQKWLVALGSAKACVDSKDTKVAECKDNWNKLRNCYNNAIKPRQKKSGQAGKIIAPWRFEEQMSFLKPYLEGRHTIGNLDATVSNEESPLPSPESPYSESPTSPESIPSRISTPISNVSNKSSMSESYLADMMEMMKSYHENRNKKQEMDDLDAFFLSMSKTVKKLPRLDQIRMKLDLIKAVSEAEIKQLESQQNVLRTPITVKSHHQRGQSRLDVNSASGCFEQPHTSYSSPSYVLQVPNTKVSSSQFHHHFFLKLCV